MKKEKILCLACPSVGFDSSSYRREYGIASFPLLKKKKMVVKFLMFIGYYLFSPILYLVYGEWKKEIDNYDLVILDTRRPAKYAVKYIKKKNKRLVMFYWNVVTKNELQPNFLKKYTNEIFTFDKSDSIKYNIGFNDTCIYEKILEKNNKKTSNNKAYYLGAYKPGRESELKKYYDLFTYYSIECDFNLVGNSNSIFKSKALNYTDYLSNVSESEYIVEIVSNGQKGLTLRTLEALYYGKKLITNNKTIKNYDFYSPKWIFIIGEDNEFEKFIHADSSEVDREYIKYYFYENWLRRLINEEIE